MEKKQEFKPSQKQKFIEAAKEHGCDESAATFEKKLKKIAKAKPTNTKADKK